ncbi:hypothetical protein LBMAG48_23010 [Phycisphaerae bacterium]|jgi:hypothetical protein|nr:hypothetical protein LBMAG48_23010 [Phycisphaerae bacterium]
MSTVPSSPRSAVYDWCEARVDPWRTNAANIGISADQALTFATSVSTYATALSEQNKLKAALEAATRTVGESYTAMRRNMTNAITDIRQYAQQQTDPNTVYELSQVPPRAAAGTAPPPGRPFDFSVQLIDDSGAVQLRWKCENPRGTQGTSYIVRRRLPSETAFTFIGVTGEKRFVDNTFVAGPDSVEYTVQAQRADSAGAASSIYTINFGLPGAGRSTRQVKDAKQAA